MLCAWSAFLFLARFMREKIYLQLNLLKSIETDKKGNYILWAEASNEELDQDEQIVLQKALWESRDYFLKNGIISLDHRHLVNDRSDPNWHPTKYIIGEPLDVVKKGLKTFVKFRLYKSSPIVKDLIAKIRDGSTRIKTSIGGKILKIIKEYSHRLGKSVEKIAKVLWNELAITWKPVNDTLAPITAEAFVKSLSTGYETDSAKITGGQALIPQDLEGADKHKKNITGVIMALIFGDVKGKEESLQFLKDRGYSEEKAEEILSEIVKNKTKITKGVLKMDETLVKSFEESIATLEKALGKSEKEEEAEENVSESVQTDDDQVVENEGSTEEEEKEETQKSLEDSIKEDEEAGNLLDVSGFLKSLVKSISEKLEVFEKRIGKMEMLQKSMVEAQVNEMKLVKSIADTPQPRKSVLRKSERTFMGEGDQKITMSREEILTKAREAMEKGKISFREASILEDRLNKGIEIPDGVLRMLKSL